MIVGTFPLTALISVVGIVGNQASASSERESANWEGCHGSCFRQHYRFLHPVPGRCPCSVGRVLSACLCCFWFLSPAGWNSLTVTNMKRILQSEHSGFGSASFVPFILSLSNIDRDNEWGFEASLCLSPLPVDNCTTTGTFLLGKCLKFIIKYSKSVIHLQLITHLCISYQEYD